MNQLNSQSIFIVSISCFALLLALKFSQERNTTELSSSAEIRQQVDYYKQQTGLQMNLQRVDREIENQKVISPHLTAIIKKNPEFSLSGEKPVSHRDPLELEDPCPPGVDQMILTAVQKAQIQKAESESEKQRYIREFLVNAERNGYRVKLDSELNVISVEPLMNRGPSSVMCKKLFK